MLAHEIGHGLGFTGYRDFTTYAPNASFQTPFDAKVLLQNEQPFFTGANAMAAYGGAVPLANAFHVARSFSADVMNPTAGPVGFTLPSALDGTILSDVGVPTIFNDSLNGSAGADTMSGGGGADTVNGGDGNDSLEGGAGAGYLRGDGGNDVIVGGSDFDDINGNVGSDTCSGGAGGDWVVGGKDNDALAGEAGEDIVYGNIGADWCDGGAGNDIVRGGQDNDMVLGQAGDDWLSGDRGDDTMTGGSGADVFHSFGDAGLDRVTDFNRAEGDRVQLDPGTQYSVAQTGADTVISMTGGGPMVLVGVSMATLTGAWIFGA